MGSTATVIAGDAPDALVDWAVGEVERCERSWSRFLPDSDLAALDAHHGQVVEVTPLLALALERCASLWDETGGAFDPTILDALERAGYDRSFELLADDGPAPRANAAPGFGDVEVDFDTRRVRLPRGTRLDLGGIGKGLAADLVAEGLVDRGARSAFVSLGGDLRVAGEVPEDGWRVPVERPVTDEILFHHTLRDGALVQSTCALRSWRRGGRSFHHIIDPVTGTSATTDVHTVIVAGSEAWRAEGLAKAAIVRGRASGGRLLRDAGVDAWLLDGDGAVTRSKGR